MKNLLELLINKKKIAYDILLNITATALPISVLQLVIYPYVARAIGGNEYGLMLTIYSIWIMLPFSLGNVLNNIKLLTLSEYIELGDEGDIALLLRQWMVLCSAIVFVLIWAYCGDFSFIHVGIGTIIAILMLLKSYLEVGFRIELNYSYVLYNNLFLVVGYIAGFFLFYLSGVWELIFLVGYLLSCVFCLLKTNVLQEKAKKTPLFFKVKNDAYSLVLAIVIKNLTGYADKLLLFPLLGGMAVSVYYTATILGKITGMLVGPINSVFLSYIARWDKSKANFFSKVLQIGILIGIVGYVVALLLTRPVIGFLFPQWLKDVMEILPLTTATIMIGIVSSILHPFVLKYCKMQWQIGINAIGSIIYFGSALVLWHYMGLKGFCIGTIIGALAKLLVMIVVYYKSVRIAN